MSAVTRRIALAIVFAIQIAGIAWARIGPTRYLSWAPYDQISFYRIDADRQGVPLSDGDIAARYRLPAAGRENRSIDHVLLAVAQYERTYGRDDGVRVRVAYRVNGGAEQVWTPTP